MKFKNCIILFIVAISCKANAQTKKLNDFLNNAVENSPLLKDYKNQVESLRYDSLLLRATFKPQITGSSINSYAPVVNGIGYDEAITNKANVNALIGVNKTFINKKNLASQTAGFALQKQLLTDTAKISEQDLRRNITAQYIITYSDQEQLKFNNEIRDLLTREEVILKKLTQKNVYRQVDYLSFVITLQQQNFAVDQLTLQYKNNYATLNYLAGIADTATTILADPGIKLSDYLQPENSIFIKKYETDSLKLLNDKAQIDINYRPKFNVYGDAGFNSSLAHTPYKNFGVSAGFSVIIPIYDGKQKRLQYSKIDLAEKTRAAYKAFALQQNKQQLALLQQQLTATEKLLSQIDLQLKYIETLITANGKLLEAGEVKITDYILSLHDLLNTKNLITQNKNTRLQLINQINYWNR
jgi:outer membrane protein TolC